MAEKIIKIHGAIGYYFLQDSITASEIEKELKGLKNESLIIDISSPGGLISEGLKIYNLLEDYPGHKTVILNGTVASMATYIAMVGDKVKRKENTVFYIHNAQGFCTGDQHDMRKMDITLTGFSNIIAKKYVKKTGKSLEEVQEAMKGFGTYYFAEEIEEYGFADEVIKGDKKDNKDDAVALAQLEVEECYNKMKEIDNKNEIEKIAAILDIDFKNSQESILSESLNIDLMADNEIKNPFPNEHAARLLDPKTKHIRVRRTSGSGDGTVQGVKVPTSIGIIWYVIKQGGREFPRAQSLRFPTKNWTEEKARKWLKDNKIKFLLFEKASGQASKPPQKAEDKNNTQEESVMTLKEFLEQNPSARLELDEIKNNSYNEGVQAVNARIDAVMVTYKEDKYKPFNALGEKAMKGECDIVAYESAVAAFDAQLEAMNSQAAQTETTDAGETPAQQQNTMPGQKPAATVDEIVALANFDKGEVH
jgi:ATP-dependent protease ClpP protease subunit